MFFNFGDDAKCILNARERVKERAMARVKEKAREKFIFIFLDKQKITNFVFHLLT